jgi:putative transposase
MSTIAEFRKGVVVPQSLSKVWLHIVFGTKNRQAFLTNPDFRDDMFRMLGHHVQEFCCFPRRAGGWVDHVHLVCGLSRTVTIAQLVEHLKTETSKWAKKPPNGMATFGWQAGYGVFSISQSNLDRVINYVDRQEAHHQRQTYQDEFRELCRRHKVEIDERYVWD